MSTASAGRQGWRALERLGSPTYNPAPQGKVKLVLQLSDEPPDAWWEFFCGATDAPERESLLGSQIQRHVRTVRMLVRRREVEAALDAFDERVALANLRYEQLLQDG